MSTESGLLQRFVIEAREHVAAMSRAVMALERGDGEAAALLDESLRCAHSLKGGAGFSGCRNIEKLAHAIETVLETLREIGTPPSANAIDGLLLALDRVGAMVDDAPHSDAFDISEPVERLRLMAQPGAGEPALLAARPGPGRPATEVGLTRSSAAAGEFATSPRVLEAWARNAAFLYGVKLDWFQCERQCGLAPVDVARRIESVCTVLDSRMELSGPALHEGLPTPPLWYWAIVSSTLGPDAFGRQLDIPCAAVVRLEPVRSAPRPEPPPPSSARAPAPSSLRVPIALIDRMLGLAGELVLIRNQAAHAADASNAPARNLMRRLSGITNELQDAALRLRMQPVGTLFDRFPRLVRDLARQLGKQIDVRISGTEVELDKTILELLADPLTHLVRNCCDHGIELPEQRGRAGKPARGVIELTARQERGQIVIAIRDDGRGLDRDAIRRKALQQGVRQAEELDRLSDGQLYDLILLSGFSTASQLTDLSGRGVGMDVVRNNLEQVGGVVEIESTPGRGAVFTLRLPLTLAIVPCLLLQSDGRSFVLAQRDVEEIVLLDPKQGRHRIERADNDEVLRLRGSLLRLVRLREMLNRRAPPRAASGDGERAEAAAVERQFVVVLSVGSQQFGLVVDAVLGNADIVVKPLHPLLKPLSVYSGATILGDGGVALILSGEGLLRSSGIAHRPRAEPAGLPPVDTAARQPVLQFRYGPRELFAAPLSAVRRVVEVEAQQIERVGERELVHVDGRAVNVLRLDQFLDVSPCAPRARQYVILPRRGGGGAGVLASEIVDTPSLAVTLDEQAYHADGVLGTALMRGQIALFLDLDRIVTMWELGRRSPTALLSAPAGQRILLVEDTLFFRKLVTGCLESAGYSVLAVDGGGAGLAALERERFDLVVSDIEMPDVDGLALARRVRGDARFVSLPLLALSSLSGAEHRRRSLEAGFDAHEVKFEREAFLRRVAGLLAQGRAAATGGGAQHV